MRFSEIVPFDVCNGEGTGCSLFVQGCDFQCPGCFNSQSWNFNNGIEWNENFKNIFLNCVNKSYINRITILGGEPLHNNNIKEIYELCKELKNIFPDKTLWIYTGYTFETVINKSSAAEEDIYRRNLLFLADVVVDGRFEQDKKDLTLAFRGSSNQRIINIQETLKQGKIILWSNK